MSTSLQMSEPPIFIGGCDRSGTTLLGRMLGDRIAAITIPESQFLLESLLRANSTDASVSRIAQTWRTHPRFRIWQTDFPDELLDGVKDIADLMRQLVLVYADARRSTVRTWIDHTPANIEYVRPLSAVFPGARFVHVIRDGRAVAASMNSTDDWPITTAVGIAHFWGRRVGFGLAAESDLPENVRRVHFEQLVAEPEKVLSDLIVWLGYRDQSECDAQQPVGSQFDLPKYTLDKHKLVNKPPDVARANAWQSELSKKQVQLFESEIGGILEHLGYERLFPTEKIQLNSLDRLGFFLRDTVAAIRSRIKRRRRIDSL